MANTDDDEPESNSVVRAVYSVFPEGNSILGSPNVFGIGNFEIGRVLHLKSEIRNLKLDLPVPRAVSDAASK